MILILIFSCLFNTSLAIDSVPFFNGAYLDLSSHAEILEDKESKFSREDIVKGIHTFKRYSQKSYFLDKNVKKYWIKLNFYNHTNLEHLYVAGWLRNILRTESKIHVFLKNNIINSYTIENLQELPAAFGKGAYIAVHPYSTITIVFEINLTDQNAKTNFFIIDLAELIKWSYKLQLFVYLTNILILFFLLFVAIFKFGKTNRYFLFFCLYCSADILFMHFSYYIILQNIIGVLLFVFFKICQSMFFVLFAISFVSDRLLFDRSKRLFQAIVTLIVFMNLIILFGQYEALHWFRSEVMFHISHVMLLTSFFVFSVLLFKLRYRYRVVFLVSYILGIIPYIVNDFFESLLNFRATNISHGYFLMYDMISNIFIILFMLLDSFYVFKMQKEIDRSSEHFIALLGGAETEKDIFHMMLAYLKSYINYDSAYFISKDNIGLQLLVDIHGIYGLDPKIVCNFIKSYEDTLNQNNIVYLDFEELSYYRGMQSGLIIRLLSDDECVGYVFLLSSKINVYSNIEMNFMSEFALKTSLVTNHLNKLRQINEKQKSVAVYENIGLFYKGNMHEIKIPLLALSDTLKIFKQTYFNFHKDNINEDLVEYMANIDESLSCCLEQINDGLSMIGGDFYGEFNIKYIKDELSSLRKIAKFMDITLEENYLISKKVVFEGPKQSIKNVVNMIVKNAIEALENLTKKDKVIKIIFQEKGGLLFVTVKDNGKGMNEEQKRKIFNLYTEGKMLSSGQGLMLCKAIIEKLGGSIAIDSSIGEYTEVDFSFDVLKKKQVTILHDDGEEEEEDRD